MVHTYDNRGERVFYDYDSKLWVYSDGDVYIDGRKRKICEKCNKPSIDINDIEDCDFCLQSLTTCDFIDNACCGHGDESAAYISLKDGRRFVLDKDWSP